MSLLLLLLVLLPLVGRTMLLLVLHLVARGMARVLVLLKVRGTRRMQGLIGGMIMIWPLMVKIKQPLNLLLRILVVLEWLVVFNRDLPWNS